MDVVGVGRGVRVGAGVDVDVDADVDMSAISSLAMSMSVEVGVMGSEIRASPAAASDVVACIITDAPHGTVSAVESDVDGVGRDAGVRREANFTVLFRANRGISDSGGSIPHPDSHRRRDRDWRRNRFVGTADTLSNRTEGDV